MIICTKYYMLSICFYYFSYADDGLDLRNVQINFFLLKDVSSRPRYLVLNPFLPEFFLL